MNRSTPRQERDDATLTRSEEELRVGTSERVVGTVRAQKRVATEHVRTEVDRARENAEFERAPANDGDSGKVETLPDGSVSIPLLEERLVVRKEVFVRERVVIRKHVVTDVHQIEAELRTERVELEGDGFVEPGLAETQETSTHEEGK